MQNFLDFYTAEIERRNARIEAVSDALKSVLSEINPAHLVGNDQMSKAVRNALATLKHKGD